MENRTSYILHGMGPDAIGLVGRMTAAIAAIGGNILDLRQDVLHGLFTIYLVIDLSDSSEDFAGLRRVVSSLSAETGLSVTVDRFTPEARSADKGNLLMILVGRDKPGIVAASSEMLGKYNANIEFSAAVGREGVFLMELMTDVSRADIPIDNLEKTLRKNMEALGIRTFFQRDDVFNKRKRALLFEFESSFLAPEAVRELADQAGFSADDLRSGSASATQPGLERALARLEGLPLDVLDKVMSALSPTEGTVELIQTLKIMGYRIALLTSGASFVADALRRRLALDYAFGAPLPEDDDARAIAAPPENGPAKPPEARSILLELAEREGLEREDIAILTDRGCDVPPGLRVRLDLTVWLDCLNRRVLSRENLLGLIDCFGIRRA
jgi:phosphoserine phosphatase